MDNVCKKDLPNGYSFIYKADIPITDIILLRKSVGWKGDTLNRWIDVLKWSLFTVGVYDAENKLVGMACLAGNARHAVMCDLCVSPEHQHKGIGQALMAQLYDAVSALKVSYVYAELAETNPFRKIMLESGFKDTGTGLFWNVKS
jgi:ribosomal protein S18 acetylase RimI-like enzyme